MTVLKRAKIICLACEIQTSENSLASNKLPSLVPWPYSFSLSDRWIILIWFSNDDIRNLANFCLWSVGGHFRGSRHECNAFQPFWNLVVRHNSVPLFWNIHEAIKNKLNLKCVLSFTSCCFFSKVVNLYFDYHAVQWNLLWLLWK